MANVIKHKRGSGSDPAANNLVLGELAIRTDTGKLFTKMDSGAIAEIAGGGSDIAINTLSSSSGTGGGSATFNGSAYRFTLSAPPNVSAAQLLVSINGVIQKPVAGTGQPSEGFSVDGTDIILGDAPATGSDFFILTFKSLGVSEPADNSVTSAKIVDGAIVNADINASAAIAGTKISPDFGSQDIVTTGHIDLPDDARIKLGDSDDFEIFHQSSNSNSIIKENGGGILSLQTNGSEISFYDITNNVIMAQFNNGGSCLFRHGATTRLATTSAGIDVTGAITGTGDLTIDTNTLHVDSSNNRVGIGTTNPNHMLDISGSNPILALNDTDTTNDRFRLTYNGGSTQLQVDPNNVRSGSHLLVAVDGSERMRINSSGHVGIGTTSPSYRLSVEAASGTDVTALFKSDDANAWIQIRDNTTTDTGVMVGANGDNLLLRAGSNTRMYLKSDGNVGIGTTSPSSKLQVEGNVQFGDGGGFDMNINGTRHQFSLGGSEKMRIDSSGNVGINETSPETTLHVENDNAHSSTFYLNSDATILAANKNSSGTRKSVLKLESDAAIVYGGPGGTLIFSDRQDERMRIDSSGHLLIGMTSASTTTQGMMFRPGQESSIFRNSGFNLLVGGAQSGQRLIDFRHNGASIGHISKSGTTGISYNEGSDYRLKENAVAISDGITRLKTLKPYRFNFKADASTTVDGFFAHELTAVPEAISGTKDEVDENNEPVYQGIDKSKLVPLLVAALQEAIGRIEVLEAK